MQSMRRHHNGDRQIWIGRSLAMQSDLVEMPSVRYRTLELFCPGIPFTLAIEHMSAYMCGITDHTLGVSG